MSNLEKELQEAELELTKIVESSPEMKLKRRIEAIKAKQHKSLVRQVQGKIKANKSGIAKEMKKFEDIKNRMEDMRQAIKALDEEASVSTGKQGELGSLSFELSRQLSELENPIPIREKKLDTSGIYEEVS